VTDSKAEFLRKEGLINPRPTRVVHPLFQRIDFFDPLDLAQVRYEMQRTCGRCLGERGMPIVRILQGVFLSVGT
jgi:hypothetical protein